MEQFVSPLSRRTITIGFQLAEQNFKNCIFGCTKVGLFLYTTTIFMVGWPRPVSTMETVFTANHVCQSRGLIWALDARLIVGMFSLSPLDWRCSNVHTRRPELSRAHLGIVFQAYHLFDKILGGPEAAGRLEGLTGLSASHESSVARLGLSFR